MNVLFLTMARIGSLEDRGVYTDLLREFFKEGHNVFVVCPMERRENKKTNLLREKGGYNTKYSNLKHSKKQTLLKKVLEQLQLSISF